MTALQNKWSKKATELYAGKTIKAIEYDADGSPMIIFTDESYLIAMQDDEGNGPGALYTSIENFSIIPTVEG